VLLWDVITRQISANTGKIFEIDDREEIGGGCINRSMVLHGCDDRRYFLKLNEAVRLSMFEAESDGLLELARAQAVRVPQPVCAGSAAGQAFLIMEYLELAHDREPAQELLGRQLATLHRVTAPRFGWHRDNTIGSTPQINRWGNDWIEFYRECRLRPQLALAVAGGNASLQSLGAELLERLPALFAGYHPIASLLHGDLWGGNAAVTTTGIPVIFDPAVYFGDREADLALTELFGGFSARFYSAYDDHWPLDHGYSVRKMLYNLYHVLNHWNLFGDSYAAQAMQMMQKLLSEIR